MAIRFRPMTETDYKDSGGQVMRGASMDHYEYLSDGLNSKAIFGDFSSRNTAEQSCLRDNVRGYIILTRPVVNYVLSRFDATLLSKILGLSNTDAKQILKFEKVWDKNLGELVSGSDIEDPKDMLCHGEILKRFIDEFSFTTGIVDEFKRIIRKELISPSADASEDIGTVKKGEGIYELLGDYYYTPSEGALRYVKKGRSLDEITNFIQDKFITNGDERIVYLLNSSKDKLYGMLFNYITVMPPGMRPDIQNRHDQFTTQYAAVIAANDALAATKNGGYTVQEVIQRYAALDRVVSQLVYKSDDRKPNQFSVTEKIQSKQGFIRGKMLSKRVDYSGRSVIVVNPKLSIDECALPKEMVPRLFRYHHLRESTGISAFKILNDSTDNNTENIKRMKIMDKVPVILNRAPTLHRLSLLAYKAKISKSKAIELNPLATTGFNADFDGDTMAVHVPLSNGSILEAQNLMLATHNLFVPASGKCTLVPRQEIIYGLNVATSSKYKEGSVKQTFSSMDEMWNAVYNHKVKVYETVTVSGHGTDLAGNMAMKHCLPHDMHKDVKEVTKESINWYVESLLDHGLEAFKRGIDKMVSLGFRIAMLYAPTVSVLNDIHDDFLADPFKEFHDSMEEAIKLYEDGFEEEKTFNSRFNKELDKVEKMVKKRIAAGLGEKNGFLRLVESGARGTVDNLIQIYAYKGRIAKSSNEAFNAVIENNFTSGLTPLEHFVSAYGTRKGLIDKVNKTADTGYQMRLMAHTCADAVVTKHDCGTTKGLTISKAELSSFIRMETDSQEERNKAINNVFVDMIIGRYETGSNRYITKKIAEEISDSRSSIKIRSPFTCEEQFCALCYGDDLSIQGDAAVGLPVGFIAAQSIGEPGTQLTMRTFQKGGVAGKGDVTSDFDRIKAFTHMTDLKGKFPTYDPISWGVGKVIETPEGLDNKRISIQGYSGSVLVTAQAEIKEDVKEIGEGLCVQQGDHDPNEVLKYKGIEAAQKYLLYILYHTYLGKATINLKHFEVLVACMTMHVVITTDRKDLKIGQFYTTRELIREGTAGTKVLSTLHGVKRIPLQKESALSNIMMENVVYGLSRAVAMGNEDALEGILQTVFLGLTPKLGTSFSGYMVDRLEKERCRA
jgi:DNA-directed RNA polymerase subunit beta'